MRIRSALASLLCTLSVSSAFVAGQVATAAPAPRPSHPAPARADLVQGLNSLGRFKTLIAAVKAVGLEDTLKKEGPFTIFAPTDAAFARLPNGTVDALLKDTEKLKSILLYHVVSGTVPSKTALTLTEATPLAGGKIDIRYNTFGLFLNGSKVTAVDGMASNGVIHIIDTVLLPSE